MLHARLGASSSERWMNCSGSPRLSEGQPDIVTEYQEEGIAAHDLAECILKGDKDGVVLWDEADDEMRQGVTLFVDLVQEELSKFGGRLFVERTVTLALLQPPEQMFGTADAVIVPHGPYEHTEITDPLVLRNYDLKYGQGVMVEVRNNPQLMYYLLGALLAEYSRRVFTGEYLPTDGESTLDCALLLFDEFESIIVQPRMSHSDGQVRRWTYTREEMRNFALVLMQRARATQAPDAPLTPGTWCRFCPAQALCPALYSHAQVVAQVDFAAVPIDTPPAPETLPIELCAELLSKIGILDNWFRALRERVTHELEQGREVPGWKLVAKRAQRTWLDADEVMRWASSSGLSLNEYAPRELASPAQLEKIVGKKNVPEELYAKVSSGHTLAPAGDSRPMVTIGPQHDFDALLPGAKLADLVEQPEA